MGKQFRLLSGGFLAVLLSAAGSSASFASDPVVSDSDFVDFEQPAPSAIRLPKEDYRDARARVLGIQEDDQTLRENPWDSSSRTGSRPKADTAEAQAGAFDQLDYSSVPEMGSYAELYEAFSRARDTRHLKDQSNDPSFLRRPSWMYPDDGCFARAGVMSQKLHQWGFVRPKKVFIFGNLRVKTQNHRAGFVTWWYHVVPLVKADGVAYALDPAIEPSRPLTLKEWVQRQVSVISSARVSICHELTYQPYSSCLNGNPRADTVSMSDQQSYLRDEWERLIELERNPEQELGDTPPWL